MLRKNEIYKHYYEQGGWDIEALLKAQEADTQIEERQALAKWLEKWRLSLSCEDIELWATDWVRLNHAIQSLSRGEKPKENSVNDENGD